MVVVGIGVVVGLDVDVVVGLDVDVVVGLGVDVVVGSDVVDVVDVVGVVGLDVVDVVVVGITIDGVAESFGSTFLLGAIKVTGTGIFEFVFDSYRMDGTCVSFSVGGTDNLLVSNGN